MTFDLPALWEEIANLIGKDLATTIYNYLQWAEIALIIATVVIGGLVILAQALRVMFCDNEEAKKALKETRKKAVHAVGYIFVGLMFAEVFWMWILPPIWSWAASSNDKPSNVINCLYAYNLL